MLFKDLLDQLGSLTIEKSDLGQVFSVDGDGEPATLGDFMAQSAPQEVRVEFGLALQTPERRGDKVKSVRTLSDSELEPVVEAYLKSIPENETLVIMGQGSFTVGKLREEVQRHTSVGERITEIVRQHNIFMEEAIKRGKIRVATEDVVHLPDFDF